MMLVLKKTFLVLTIACIFLLNGCALFSKKKTPTKQKVEIVMLSSDFINPNKKNEPSPVEINFYEFDDIVDFNQTSYRELVEGNQFKKQKIKQSQFFLKPNSVISGQLSVSSKSKYLIVIASFLNIEKSQWKLSFFKQKKPFLSCGLNYLNIYVDDLKMIQLNDTKLRKKLKQYAKKNPSQKNVDNDGNLIPIRGSYEKGIYKQLYLN